MISRVETIDGSATEGEDYEPVNEVLTFEPNESEKEVNINNERFEALNIGSLKALFSRSLNIFVGGKKKKEKD